MLGGILVVACLLAFAPLYPSLPDAGLDPSWVLAMNQAVAQGSVFGRDIVFTFGPYSALYTQAYHPATYPWTLSLGLLLGLCYGAMLLTGLRKHGNGWLWLYAVFLFLVDSRDALFFSYPLLLALVACKATLPVTDSRHLAFSQRARIDYVFAIASLGVLPIVKGSFLPLSVVAALAGFTLYWVKGERLFAPVFIVLPALTMIVLWHMAGQPVTALPDYFRSISPIISGFSEAMSSQAGRSSPLQIAVYVSVALLILVPCVRERNNSVLHRTALVLCVGLFLFVAFKAGFVRHDSHALVAGSALVLATIALKLFGIARVPLPTLAIAIMAWALIHWIHVGTFLQQTSLYSLYGVISGNRMGGRLQTAFVQRLDTVNAATSIPKLKGTTDIYPYDQSALISSGNNWVSRPVLQSYSVYTPDLARMNEAHLRGPRAPDNIVFRVAPIDGRFPTLDDGLSWPTMISRYAISTTDKNYIYLKKRPMPSEASETVVMQGSYHLGEQVDLPEGEHMLFAEIDVAPTLWGRLALIVFKSVPLDISVSLVDGSHHTYRFIPSMARTGFILSPLIESNTDFVHLAVGELRSLDGKKVKSIRITPKGVESVFWKREYSLRGSVLEAKSGPPLQRQNGTLPMHQQK